jgi:hypothetical protein
MQSRSFGWPAFVIGLSLVISGCGGPGAESVSGTVTLDGAPLTGARLTAVPSNPEIKGPFIATTDSQGHYALGPIGDPGGGLPPGDYRLSITTAFNETVDEMTAAPPERAPAPYPAGVDFTVTAGGQTDANFDLKSK